MIFGKSITIDREELGGVAISPRKTIDAEAAEQEFIEKLRSGDSRAFDLLVTRYSPEIYGLLYRIMRDPEEAADVTQETFLRAFRAIRKFRGDSAVKTWLFRIAINQSRNRYRWWKRRKKDQTVSFDDKIGGSELTVGEIVRSECKNPEEDTLRREREDLLQDAISELPDIFREAIVLCDIQGFTYEEIARVLDINIGTVKSRISRGREELRRRIADI